MLKTCNYHLFGVELTETIPFIVFSYHKTQMHIALHAIYLGSSVFAEPTPCKCPTASYLTLSTGRSAVGFCIFLSSFVFSEFPRFEIVPARQSPSNKSSRNSFRDYFCLPSRLYKSHPLLMHMSNNCENMPKYHLRLLKGIRYRDISMSAKSTPPMCLL